MSYNVPDYDESYERRLADEEAEESALDESVEPVEIVSVTEVEDEDPEQTEYLRETYGTGGWQ